MTNPIGTGTATKTFNGPADFMSQVYKLALRQAPSLSEFLRRAAVNEIERSDPTEAARLRAHLRQYYGSLAFALVTLFHFTTATTARAAGEQCEALRRAPRSYRVTSTRKAD